MHAQDKGTAILDRCGMGTRPVGIVVRVVLHPTLRKDAKDGAPEVSDQHLLLRGAD